MWQELRVISCACMCLMCLLVLRALEAESLLVLQQFSTEGGFWQPPDLASRKRGRPAHGRQGGGTGCTSIPGPTDLLV